VDTLRRLHAIRGVAADGSVVRRIEALLASAWELGLPRPAGLDGYLKRLHAFAGARRTDPRFQPGLCHNDFWHNNFLDDGERLWLVDWEFSGDGDPLFDVATFCLGARYTAEQQEVILAAFGCSEPGNLALLREMQSVVFLFEGAWALVQHALRGSAEYDYQAHAARMFGRLEDWRAG
jgi:thiamine kinase-like enzyme